MNRRAGAHRGDKAALLALIGILIIFIAIVGRGWQTLLSTQGIYVSSVVGTIVALIATMLAYAIGAERVYHPLSKATPLAYFFVLFNLSALGTVNAMFVMFQSTNVLREQVESANSAVVLLRDIGASSVDTADFDRFKSNISDKWRNLKAELENPQLCGQGPVAAARMQELQFILPSFRPLGGGGRCEKVPLLIASYEKQIEDLVKESPEFLSNKARLELKARINSESSKMLDELSDVGRTLSSDFRLAAVKAQLFDVAERYAVVRQELAASTRQPLEKIPQKLDVRSVSALGDIGQVLPFIVSRLSEPSTYVYLAIALILDIAVILAFARVLREGPSHGQRQLAASVRKL